MTKEGFYRHYRSRRRRSERIIEKTKDFEDCLVANGIWARKKKVSLYLSKMINNMNPWELHK